MWSLGSFKSHTWLMFYFSWAVLTTWSKIQCLSYVTWPLSLSDAIS